MFWSGSVAAQESGQAGLNGLSLEDLAKVKVDSVYGASKFLQKADDAANSTTVVTAEDIQKYGYRTLADVLRTIRGFYVINDRNYSYVGVRGLSIPGDYNARILFLLDGHRLNDNIFDGAYVGTGFPVDIALIRRIEVIRGPNSSVYGTGAFVALINVITERGRDLDATELGTEAGSRNTYKGRVTYGGRFDSGLETFLSGSYFDSHGQKQLFYPEFDSPSTNNGLAQDADGNSAYSMFGDVIYRDFNVHVLQGSVTKHIPTASFGTVFNDPRTRTTDARSYVDVQYHHTFGSWETLGRASYDWYDYHGTYVYDYAGNGTPPFTENFDSANGAWWDFQADASRVFGRHKVTLGTESRQDVRQQQVNYDVQPYHLYFDDHRSADVWALYVQDQYSIRKQVAVVGGLRSDWRRAYGNTLSPRVGLHLTPRPNTEIRLNYSSAFRMPNSYETSYAGNDSNTANPFLQPERIRSWQVDAERRFGDAYYVTGTGFVNGIDDLIVQSHDPITDRPLYTNSTPATTKGVEFEVGATLPGGEQGAVSYSFQDSRDVATGAVLTNSPRHLAKANLSFPLLQKKLFASIDAQYVSERRTIAQTTLSGFFVADLTVFARKVGERFDLSGGLYNMFDERYADSGGLEHVQASIPQDGRSVRITLTFRPRGFSR